MKKRLSSPVSTSTERDYQTSFLPLRPDCLGVMGMSTYLASRESQNSGRVEVSYRQARKWIRKDQMKRKREQGIDEIYSREGRGNV